MNVDEIKRTELNANEREILEHDKERWKRMGASSHLKEWLEYYDGLAIRRRLAMRIAYTNKPEGRGYTTALSQLYAADGFDTKDKSAMTRFTAVLWLRDEPEREIILREILDAMTPGQRAGLNSPITARQRVEAVLKARKHGKTAEARVRESPVAMLKQKIVELEREKADLATKLARADNGSVCDLKGDTADQCSYALVENSPSLHKAETIAKGMLELVKRKRQRPAG